MTTMEYYSRIMRIYIGETVSYFLASAGCFWLMVYVTKGHYLWSGVGVVPFLVLLLFSLNRLGILLMNKSKMNFDGDKRETSPLIENQLFIAFLPSPTLHMIFFTGDGVYAGCLKDKRTNIPMWILPAALLLLVPRSYRLWDNEGNMLAEYKVKYGLNGAISILDSEGRRIGVYKQELRMSGVTNEHGIRQYEGKMEHSAAFTVAHARSRQAFAEFNSGWMPAYTSGRFFDANMPVLSFLNATEDEKRIAFSYCVDYLQAHNH